MLCRSKTLEVTGFRYDGQCCLRFDPKKTSKLMYFFLVLDIIGKLLYPLIETIQLIRQSIIREQVFLKDLSI